MAFRLLFWRRPKLDSAGRHARATALPVPDSTGTLVPPAVAAEADLDATAPVPIVGDSAPTPLLPEQPRPEPGVTTDPTVVPAIVAETDETGPGSEQPDEVAQSAAVPAPAAALEAATAAVEASSAPPVPVAGVGLGFADGASVELHPDDPRVTSFRAAAAALLDVHEA